MLTLSAFKEKLASFGMNRWPKISGFESLWCLDMKASREDLWSYITDTSRMNRDLELAPREQVEKDGLLLVKTTLLGMSQEWTEEPWFWVADKVTGASRIYSKGITKTFQVYFYVDGESQTDKRSVYIYFGWEPRNFLSGLFLRLITPALKEKFQKTFNKIDRHLSEPIKSNAFIVEPPALNLEGLAKLKTIRQELALLTLDRPELAGQLCDYVQKTDDMDLEPIRVMQLAREWNAEPKALLQTALHATRMGLLKISWDVVCPHCRGSRVSAASLGELPEAADCEACDVEFKTDEPNAIEVMFHVHESIREVKETLFCAGEPNKKTHIKAQQRVMPGEVLALQPKLKKGTYRVRSVGREQQVRLDFDPACQTGAVEIGMTTSATFTVGPQTKILIHNSSADAAIFVIEELWWEDRALKPAQVFALPEFRDLFAQEHLNAKVKLYLGEQTLLFTDIVGSTNYYRSVGDAKAFVEVRNHFQDVFGIVKKYNGVVVKTIGDAVMASFPATTDAMKAAVSIQETFAADRVDTPIRLRISVHCGQVMGVQLNTGIDYFGNTVNFAAKIQAHAETGEIAMSSEVYFVYSQSPLAAKGFPVDQQKFKSLHIPADVFVMNVHKKAQARQSA